jgi:2-polyprenyl-6-methoxyphenol hydroxylase-like FAD-dependent oxidoreductase
MRQFSSVFRSSSETDRSAHSGARDSAAAICRGQISAVVRPLQNPTYGVPKATLPTISTAMTVESAPNTETKPKTGIKVVIVGAGFGGLCAAIESHLQGHDVVLLENFPALKPLGDIISFGSNAGHIFHSWSDGYISRQFRPLCIDSKEFDLRKFDGEKVLQQPSPAKIHDWPVFNGHRGELHMIIYHYAKDVLGIPIRLGCRVVEYFEDANGAGVIIEGGEKVTGDVVIGADGVRSKARELVLGYFDKPRSSGFAIFRAWFTTEKILADPVTRELAAHGDSFTGWIGPDVHFLVAVLKDGKDISWVLTHKVSS